jgi:hypothetical protein
MMLGSITRSFSTTNHHKMFDIVAADEDDPSFPVDRQGFDYCYPSWCVAAAEPVEHVTFSPANAGQRNNMEMSRKRADLDGVPTKQVADGLHANLTPLYGASIRPNALILLR